MSAALPKSTIVRITNQSRRWLFRSGEVLAPRLGGRAVRNLWFSVPPLVAETPLPPAGTPFTVRSLGAAVRGHVWGEGPVVYLVHGWGGRGSQLAAFVAPLTSAGFRVVLFDAPAHGRSEPGPSGPGRTHGVEMGRALDEVAARFGPAHAVVAHSLGTMATYLALRYGWLGTGRLVLLAPMVEATPLVDQFQHVLGFGRRTRRAFERDAQALVGLPLSEFDARVQARHVDPVPTLVVHDRGDRQTPYADSARLVAALPQAELLATEGLGHRRVLQDPGVVAAAVAFIRDDVQGAAA
jgi:pimeloyl-ACP methyl ester carboxylesterase